MSTNGNDGYTVIDSQTELAVGDRFQHVIEVKIPDWIPGSDRTSFLETLIGYSAELQTRINNAVDAGEVSVERTDVVETDDGVFYLITYEVQSVAETETPLTPAAIWFVVKAVLVILGLVGIGFVIRETRLLLQEPGGALVALGALGLGFFYLKDRDSDPDGDGVL